MSYLKLTLLLLALVYLGMISFSLLFANRMAFPAPRPEYTRDADFLQFIEGVEPDSEIALRFLPSDKSKHAILYSYGNAEDMGRIEKRIEVLNQMGFAVLAWDYPGYGQSDGSPTESSILKSSQLVWNHLNKHLGFAPENIILYGRSIGSGPSTYLAEKNHPGGLILEGGFTSAYRVMTQIKLLPWDIFDNLARIDKIKIPILFLQGTDDETVPFSHGKKLYAKANEPKTHTWFENGRHNNLVEDYFDLYKSSVLQFMESIDPQFAQLSVANP